MLRKPLYLRMATLTAFAALTLAGATPAKAQKPILNVNQLLGKSYAQLEKMYGKPVKSSGSPIGYAVWHLPGVNDLTVWWNRGTVNLKQVQIHMMGAPADPEAIAKKFGVSLGAAPLKFTRVLPSLAVVSRNLPPSVPWGKVFVGYNYPLPYQTDLIAFCKAKGLKPTSTYFWTLQLTPPRGASRSNQVSAGGGG